MPKHMRRIGTIGTASCVVVALGLLYLALADGLSCGLGRSPDGRRMAAALTKRR
jgi:hypothetical protein